MSVAERDRPVRQRLGELVEDLRVALMGAQLLFAFLLTLPFTSRFTFIAGGAEKNVFFVAFISAVISCVLLIAPSACHRVYHELHDPGGLDTLLRISGILAVAGTFFLALSMATVVFLITDALYRRGAASLVCGVVLGLTVCCWFALPLLHRMRY